MRGIVIFGALILSLFQGCRGFDDDSKYEIDTRSMFFLAENGSGDQELIRVTPDQVLTRYEENFGIPAGQLSDFYGSETEIWLANAQGQYVRKINLQEESNYESLTDLNLQPYFICPGDKYLMISDSLSKKIAFWDLKKEKLLRLDADGKPGPVFYNNQKFYLILDNRRVVIYNELALTPTHDHDLEREIVQAGFDKNLNLRVITQDSAGYYLNMIEHNADFVGFLGQDISYQQARYTPYLSSRFGTEYLQDLTLGDFQVNLQGFPDSLDHFEVDFFRGQLYGTFRDSLAQYDLRTFGKSERGAFPYRIHKSFTYIDRP